LHAERDGRAGGERMRGARLARGRSVLPEVRLVVGATQVVVSLHALCIVVGVVVGGAVAVRRSGDPGLALATVAAVATAALAGAHALFVALHGGDGLWTGGLASIGGILAALATTVAVARATGRPIGALLDAIVPAGLVALAIGRIGCFLGGCCFGRPTTLPWGVVLPELGPPARHPLQLYSAAADVAAFLALAGRARLAGTVACRGLVAFGVVRAVLETLRDPATTDALVAGWLTLPQAAAIALAMGALACRSRLRRPCPIDYASRPEESRAWPMRRR
jgi:phosphatidylglycerol:prolipoprotein diacylglycerol transferase